MRRIAFLLAVMLASVALAQVRQGPVTPPQQSASRVEDAPSNAADAGTNGDVIMTSPAPYTSAGILLLSKTTWPDIIAKTGTTSTDSAFGVNNASDLRLFTVRSDGNVGVGVANPIVKLQVGGTLYAATLHGSAGNTGYTPDGVFGATANPSMIITPHGQQLRFGYHDAGAGQYYPSIGFAVNSTWLDQSLLILQSRVAQGTPESFNRFQVSHGGEFGWGPGITAVDTRLYRQANSGLRTNASLLVDGNLGIGATLPNRKLDIRSNGDGITFGQHADNVQAIQTYVDDHWTDRATYGACCNGLLIQPDGGWVAIGTTNPMGGYKLEVAGQIYSSSGGFRFPDNTVQTTAVSPTSWTRSGSGLSTTDRVGIGTSSPNGLLDVQGGGDGIVIGMRSDNVVQIQTYIDGQWANRSTYANGCCNMLLLEPDAGQVVVGPGTPAVTTKLHVGGNIVATGSITGATVIGATYQDVAEWVPATNDLIPGTVVILDTTTANQVTAARGSYDTRVAGVVSAQPGLILGEAADSKEMIATTGRVKVRVDATTHPIAIGDLLVTSDKTGLAMKSVPSQMDGRLFHQPGTIIGKALEPLASGEGEILVLLSLQ